MAVVAEGAHLDRRRPPGRDRRLVRRPVHGARPARHRAEQRADAEERLSRQARPGGQPRLVAQAKAPGRGIVTQLEKQLPGKAEMDALLSDINQAGLGRGLQFELFRPGQVAIKDYYAELPISIKVTGRYHDCLLYTSPS